MDTDVRNGSLQFEKRRRTKYYLCELRNQVRNTCVTTGILNSGGTINYNGSFVSVHILFVTSHINDDEDPLLNRFDVLSCPVYSNFIFQW